MQYKQYFPWNWWHNDDSLQRLKSVYLSWTASMTFILKDVAAYRIKRNSLLLLVACCNLPNNNHTTNFVFHLAMQHCWVTTSKENVSLFPDFYTWSAYQPRCKTETNLSAKQSCILFKWSWRLVKNTRYERARKVYETFQLPHRVDSKKNHISLPCVMRIWFCILTNLASYACLFSSIGKTL